MSATQTVEAVGAVPRERPDAAPRERPERVASRVTQNEEVGTGAASPVSTTTAVVAVDPRSAKALGATGNMPDDFGPLVSRLPIELDVMVPVRDFRVRSLLALEAGQIIESQWGHGEDVPLAAGAVTLAWCEFEVIENQLAVRITRVS